MNVLMLNTGSFIRSGVNDENSLSNIGTLATEDCKDQGTDEFLDFNPG